MGDDLPNPFYDGPYGPKVFGELAKKTETLVGAQVFVTAYEEAIRKWKQDVRSLWTLVQMDGFTKADTTKRLKKLLDEMEATLK